MTKIIQITNPAGRQKADYKCSLMEPLRETQLVQLSVIVLHLPLIPEVTKWQTEACKYGHLTWCRLPCRLMCSAQDRICTILQWSHACHTLYQSHAPRFIGTGPWPDFSPNHFMLESDSSTGALTYSTSVKVNDKIGHLRISYTFCLQSSRLFLHFPNIHCSIFLGTPAPRLNI